MNTRANPHQEFLNWYQKLHEPFVRYCTSRAFGIMETEDLVQDAILATLQAFHTVNDKNKLLGFMIGVANNMLKNKMRRKKFHGDWEEELMEQLESKNLNPELATDISYLLKAIEQLSEKQKEALILFEISGFKIKEIAEIQESNESATKTRISRARKKVKEMLSEDNSQIPLSKRLAIYCSILF